MTNYQQPQIKIHVAATDVERASQTIFGLDTDVIIKAMMGDKSATTYLADYANITDKARKNIKPVLKQAATIYSGLEISPVHIHKDKKAHKDALLTLGEEIVSHVHGHRMPVVNYSSESASTKVAAEH